MGLSKLFLLRTVFGLLLLVALCAHSQAFGASESILWNFNGSDGSTDGLIPFAGLIRDASGNLYGTTFLGGTIGFGTVFELSPPSTIGGDWTESILWNFGSGTDGKEPRAALLMDTSGNLYGTTQYGGTNCSSVGCGTVFELSPPSTSGGDWAESILWSFGNGSDGQNPEAGLIIDTKGNLYGNTSGAVFELSPPSTSGGDWTESILGNYGSDGYAGLVMDKSGNLYGTTLTGGTHGHGTVFELTPPSGSGGKWTQSTLWNFGKGTDGIGPFAGLITDTSGNLYGTTGGGGTHPRNVAGEPDLGGPRSS